MLRKVFAVTLTVVFTIVTLMMVKADTKHHTDGYRTSTTATGGKDRNRPLYRAWADYFGKLYRDASVDKIKGEYNLVAFVAGGENPRDAIKKFTLKRKFLGIPVGDEEMKHHYDVASWTGTNPYAYAQAAGKLGSLRNKTERWNSSSP